MFKRGRTIGDLFPYAAIAILLLSSGCMNYKPFEVRDAHPGITEGQNKELKLLPPPDQKVVVGVYNFSDQTGQYKIAEGGGYSFSTAVTQGATSILINVLQNSGWFVPIERHDLSDLLNERKIISSIRAEYAGPDGKKLGPLPPLLYAGIIIEGGIISYDSNVITGGSGFRLLGIGSSGQFTQNQITIYLRAVSTQNGAILENVNTTKTILSKKLQGGAFLYVSTNYLLETETGYSYNEPTTMAVKAAINEAVKDLIIKGVKDHLWTLKNPDDATTNELFKNYDSKKDIATDEFDRIIRKNLRSTNSIYVNGRLSRIEDDKKYPQIYPSGNIELGQQLEPHLEIGMQAGYGRLGNYESLNKIYTSAQLYMQYILFPYSRLTPYLRAGGGGIYVPDSELNDRLDKIHPVVSGGLGFEYMIANRLGLNLEGIVNYSLDDKLDYIDTGKYYDSIWGVNMGLKFYFPLIGKK